MRYEAPRSLDQAVALLAAEPGEARVLAGGTDLLVQMKTDLIDPVLVVDIKGIAETRQIKEEAGGFRVGAAVTGAELKEHARLKAVWPGVVEAANLIGSTQIQGRASMGGNLCNGSPAADSVPALIAAGAKGFHRRPQGPSRAGWSRTSCWRRASCRSTKGEIVASFLLPARAGAHRGCLSALHSAHGDGHRRGRLRNMPHPRCQGRLHGGARIPGRGRGAAIAGGRGGQRPDRHQGRRRRVAEARCRCTGRLPPIDDKRGTKEYRVKVAGVLARRATQIALERARKA